MPLRSTPAASPGLEKALRAETARILKLGDPADQVRGISAVLATLEAEYTRLNAVRLVAIMTLRGEGLSLDAIARRTGLSKTRVAQLAKQAQGMPHE